MNRHLVLRVTVKDGGSAPSGRATAASSRCSSRAATVSSIRSASSRSSSIASCAPNSRRSATPSSKAARSDLAAEPVRGGRDQGRRARHRQPELGGRSTSWPRGSSASSGRWQPASMSNASTSASTRRSRCVISLMVTRERNPHLAEHVITTTRPACSMSRVVWWRWPCAGSARLLDGQPQDRGQALRLASAGGGDHRAGDADQGPHRAARDADRVPPDRGPRSAWWRRSQDVDGWLYRLVQFAIREAVASRTLDEVLSAKGALDAELRAFRARAHRGDRPRGDGARREGRDPAGRDPRSWCRTRWRRRSAPPRRFNQIRRQEDTAATRSAPPTPPS